MKKFTFLIAMMLLATVAISQNADKRWAIGVGGGPYRNMGEDKTRFMTDLYFSRFISSSFDVMLKQEFGWWLAKNQETGNTEIWDLGNTQLNLRYNIIKGRALQPYVYAGPGIVMDNGSTVFGMKDDEKFGDFINWNVGIGAKFLISKNTALYFEGGYISGIDTKRQGSDVHDNFIKGTIGLEFAFSPPQDLDGDGVPNRKDDCPDTPPGVQVDERGCPLDRDGDGVPDYKDDCPDDPGLERFNGCPDRDGDGIIDKEDECPDTPGLKKFNGCPDSDEDGVPDNKDKCPDTPKGCPVDADGCPLDSDGDGVIDCQDDCPTEAGLVDNNGCPAEWAEKKVEPVYFDFDKSNLKPAAIEKLDKIVEILNSSAEYDVVVAGYCDSIGTEKYNLGLSERRAQSVVKYLFSKGINNAYVGTEGYGESNPAVPNTSSANRALNRRAEFEIQIKER